jgi:EAL domain-containing protein (putative c-di-GMP-specific phosphodiesterase class I)
MSDSQSKNTQDTSGPFKNLADEIKRSMAEALSAEQQRLAEEEAQKETQKEVEVAEQSAPAATEQQARAKSAPGQRPRVSIGEALRNQWFEFWYQPKVDLKRKCLAGAEALARIRHPEHGVLLPGGFLADVDEESVAELGEHTLLAALNDWTVFEDAGFNLQLSINVPISVLHKLPIAELVAKHRPQSKRWDGLIVDVTEDQIVRDLALAQEVATQLAVSDIKIAIDDFGAGYSSLSSLRELPFKELKLDRSFVTGCSLDATNAAICQTAIDLAHRFGSDAVAEGVETQTDLQALMVMGCDYGQGALMSPPMPKDNFVKLLQQRMSKPSTRGASPNEAMRSGGKPIGRVA